MDFSQFRVARMEASERSKFLHTMVLEPNLCLMPGAGLCLNRFHDDFVVLDREDLHFLSGQTICMDGAQGLAH